jgi:dTDP-4-amino-4,6-dideoxygalactose transaminase
VFVSDLTFIASANPVVYQGAKPVFVDCCPNSWTMDLNALEQALSKHKHRLPKAVVVAHITGQPADMKAILEVCRKFDVPVVEDAAEALGAKIGGQAAGTFGDVGCYSFNGNKIITTSGGGMLVAKNSDLTKRARWLAAQAREAGSYYEHNEIGYNYRMSNLLAAVGLGQLEVLDERVARKRQIFEIYQRELAGLEGVTWQAEIPNIPSTRWLPCLLLDVNVYGRIRDEFCKHFCDLGYEARPIWKPMHLQPVFKQCEFVGSGSSAKVFEGGIALPSPTAASDSEIQGFAKEVQKYLETKLVRR